MAHLPFPPTFAVLPMKGGPTVYEEGVIYMFKPGSNPAQILRECDIDTLPPKGCRHGPLDLERMVIVPDDIDSNTEFDPPTKVLLKAHRALASGEPLQEFYQSDAVAICLGKFKEIHPYP